MRCKPGDLAIVVRQPKSDPTALGAILAVVQLVKSDSEPMWWCKSFRPYICRSGNAATDFCIKDAYLRPIRPGDLEDETPRDVIKELTE